MTSPLTQLIEAIDPRATLIHHWPLTGGVSAQTTAFEIETPDGERERFVLRQHGDRDRARDPDIARHEFQLLTTLHAAGIPVPAPIFVDPAVGIVVEFVEGDIRITSESPPTDRELIEMAHWLTQIHQLDLESADLSFLISVDYQSADRLEHRPGDSALVREICKVLQRVTPIPTVNQPTLLHGDYWRGNLLWEGSRIVSIIDWEDAMIADPVIELARARLELYWIWGAMFCEEFTRQYVARNTIDLATLPQWDLAMALTFARAVRGWGLPEERELEMLGKLEQFVDQAIEQLSD
ncbi:MAG: phosphotransferase family protein [Sphaerobacteraceae bacterium]|nr:MAG: phosphotransferase family protein [Sphaerobacteraceae bacterium]